MTNYSLMPHTPMPLGCMSHTSICMSTMLLFQQAMSKQDFPAAQPPQGSKKSLLQKEEKDYFIPLLTVRWTWHLKWAWAVILLTHTLSFRSQLLFVERNHRISASCQKKFGFHSQYFLVQKNDSRLCTILFFHRLNFTHRKCRFRMLTQFYVELLWWF